MRPLQRLLDLKWCVARLLRLLFPPLSLSVLTDPALGLSGRIPADLSEGSILVKSKGMKLMTRALYIYIIIYPMISNYIRGLKAPAITSQNVMMLCFCWNEPLDCLDHVDPLDSRPCLDRLGHLDPRDLKKGPIAVSSHIFSVSKPVPWATCPLQMIHET